MSPCLASVPILAIKYDECMVVVVVQVIEILRFFQICVSWFGVGISF